MSLSLLSSLRADLYPTRSNQLFGRRKRFVHTDPPPVAPVVLVSASHISGELSRASAALSRASSALSLAFSDHCADANPPPVAPVAHLSASPISRELPWASAVLVWCERGAQPCRCGCRRRIRPLRPSTSALPSPGSSLGRPRCWFGASVELSRASGRRRHIRPLRPSSPALRHLQGARCALITRVGTSPALSDRAPPLSPIRLSHLQGAPLGVRGAGLARAWSSAAHLDVVGTSALSDQAPPLSAISRVPAALSSRAWGRAPPSPTEHLRSPRYASPISRELPWASAVLVWRECGARPRGCGRRPRTRRPPPLAPPRLSHLMELAQASAAIHAHPGIRE
ncbi:hypothetical protein LXA43DRAFT_1099979 [Ganoderma leucocontextum]|nr:hypothetical protein LXA43DRAFT_1099979 [Ganoderma leucocontextum]